MDPYPSRPPPASGAPGSPRPWLALAVGLLTGLGAGGCYAEEQCLPGDTSYICCVKVHLGDPAACGASEREAEALRLASPPHSGGAPSRGTSLAVGTAIASATVSSDDVILSQELRVSVEKALRECAQWANEAVNRRRFGGDPTPAQCKAVVGTDDRGEPKTEAMRLGEEKHTEALACVADRLGRLLPGRFSLEQRYRYDPVTRKKELMSEEERQTLLSQGKYKQLKGTLVPDVVIHSGDPLKVQAIYDFKFPCLRKTLPKWTVYTDADHPFRDQSQGDAYEAVFEVKPKRVTPWEFM